MKKRKFLFFFLINVFLFFSYNLKSQTCNGTPLVFGTSGSQIVDGVRITVSGTGDLSTFPTTSFSCLPSITIPANSTLGGGSVLPPDASPYTFTFTFSKPVNNVAIVVNGTGSEDDEIFTITTDDRDEPTLIDLFSCYTLIAGNVITSGRGAPSGSGSGGGGGFVVSVNNPLKYYTSLTINSPGGSVGSRLALCTDNWITLPVELTYFDASVVNNNVNLNWSTATEDDNSHFEIEYSLDGSNWEYIDEVIGQGTTLEPSNYNYIHYQVNELSNNLLYYRLKQIDYDGNYTYSAIKVIYLNNVNEIRAFPNPIHRGSDLTIYSKEKMNMITIYNTMGQLVKEIRLDQPLTSTIINTASLSRGSYYLNINTHTQYSENNHPIYLVVM